MVLTKKDVEDLLELKSTEIIEEDLHVVSCLISSINQLKRLYTVNPTQRGLDSFVQVLVDFLHYDNLYKTKLFNELLEFIIKENKRYGIKKPVMIDAINSLLMEDDGFSKLNKKIKRDYVVRVMEFSEKEFKQSVKNIREGNVKDSYYSNMVSNEYVVYTTQDFDIGIYYVITAKIRDNTKFVK